jgi:hypothetical protein
MGERDYGVEPGSITNTGKWNSPARSRVGSEDGKLGRRDITVRGIWLNPPDRILAEDRTDGQISPGGWWRLGIRH